MSVRTMRADSLLDRLTTKLRYRSSLLNNLPWVLRIVTVKMKAQYVVNRSFSESACVF